MQMIITSINCPAEPVVIISQQEKNTILVLFFIFL